MGLTISAWVYSRQDEKGDYSWIIQKGTFGDAPITGQMKEKVPEILGPELKILKTTDIQLILVSTTENGLT